MRLCVDMVETVGRTNHDAGRFGIFQLALVLVVAGAGAAFHRMFLDPDVVAADPAVAVALRHLRHNAPRLASVFGQFDFPGRAVHPGREDVGYDYVRPDIVFVGRIGACELGVAAIEPDLVIVGALRGLEIGVDDFGAVDLVDHEAVGRAVAAACRTPEITARAAVDAFEEFMRAHVVRLEIVRMGAHQGGVLIPGDHVEHLFAVEVARVVAQRDVVVEDYHFIRRDEAQVFLQPCHLLVGEAARVVRAGEDDVVHRNEMHVAAVERVPARPEHVAVGVTRIVHRTLVVVADRGEERDARFTEGAFHRGEGLGVALAQDVAKGDADHRDRVLGGDLLHVGYRFRAEPMYMVVVVGLRVAQPEEQEPLVALGELAKREVCPVGFRTAAGDGVGRLVGTLVGAEVRLCRDLVPRRHGDEYVLGVGVAHDLVDALLIACHDAVPVAHDDPFEGVALLVAYQPVEGDALVGRDLRFAPVVIAAGFGQFGDHFVVSAASHHCRSYQCCGREAEFPAEPCED